MTTNREILRAVITQATIGTPGAGLLSPDQFDAFWELAETNNPWMQIQDTVRRTAFTGGIPRIDFGDNVIEAATESIDTGNFFSPVHDFVAYAMVKSRLAFKFSFEAEDQDASGGSYEDQLVDGFTRAFGRSHQRLAWLGDDTSADTSLSINDGWLKQIVAGGNVVDGSAINGGDISVEHFYEAIFALPDAWQQRANELRWAVPVTKVWQIRQFLSNRATGLGDQFVTEGPNGELRIAGIPMVEVPPLTTDIVLSSPQNTSNVVNPRTFRLRRVDQGLSVVAQDIVAHVGFMHDDFILREVTGIAVITSLNL